VKDNLVSLRIAVGGIASESCTFSPRPTVYEDFSILKESQLCSKYGFIHEYAGIECIPLIYAWAGAGGSVAADSYARLKQEFLHYLAKDDCEGVYLDLHGALNVEGIDDAELDFIRDVRSTVGDGCPIVASYDLHGNLSRDTASELDALSAYRTAPHIDAHETRKRAFDLLVEILRTPSKLHTAYISIPLSLPGEQVMTTVEPGHAIYNTVSEVAAHPGVSDASLLTGYVWADELRNGASAFVIGSDHNAVEDGARKLAQKMWDNREKLLFGMPTGTADECIQRAIESNTYPFFISDAGDNPTGGGVGDIPYCLERLIAADVERALVASIVDGPAVRSCFSAGADTEITVELGGKLDPVHGSPLQVTCTVQSLHERGRSNRMSIVSIGGIRVILTENRSAFTSLAQFENLGIDLRNERVVVIKLGYLFPELREIAAETNLALTPGAIDPNVVQLEYRRIRKEMFPFDRNAQWEPPKSCLIR
jgi:microcystin degradation protein MlrC